MCAGRPHRANNPPSLSATLYFLQSDVCKVTKLMVLWTVNNSSRYRGRHTGLFRLRACRQGRACDDGHEQRARGALGRAHAQRGPARVVRRVERIAAEQRDDLCRLRLCRATGRALLC